MANSNVLFHFHARKDAVYDLVTHVLYKDVMLVKSQKCPPTVTSYMAI